MLMYADAVVFLFYLMFLIELVSCLLHGILDNMAVICSNKENILNQAIKTLNFFNFLTLERNTMF